MDLGQNNIQKFMKYAKSIAKKNKIKIRFPNQKSVRLDEFYVSGYFDEGERILVAAKKSPQFLQIFVHEFSHMQQYIEKSEIWEMPFIYNNVENDPNEMLDSWLEYKIELTTDEIHRCINLVRDVELDCEKRAVKNIIDFNLPIDIGNYIQGANAYLYLYSAIKISRMWTAQNKSPYLFTEITDKMPKHFCNDYDEISPELFKLYMTYCFLPKEEICPTNNL